MLEFVWNYPVLFLSKKKTEGKGRRARHGGYSVWELRISRWCTRLPRRSLIVEYKPQLSFHSHPKPAADNLSAGGWRRQTIFLPSSRPKELAAQARGKCRGGLGISRARSEPAVHDLHFSSLSLSLSCCCSFLCCPSTLVVCRLNVAAHSLSFRGLFVFTMPAVGERSHTVAHFWAARLPANTR